MAHLEEGLNKAKDEERGASDDLVSAIVAKGASNVVPKAVDDPSRALRWGGSKETGAAGVTVRHLAVLMAANAGSSGHALPLTLQCVAAEQAEHRDNRVLLELIARSPLFDGRADSNELSGAHEVSPATRLQAARAWGELAEIERTRAALEAADEGVTQREIGRLLDVSQTEIHRLLRRARTANRDWGREGAREVILRHRAGLISHGTMVGRLAGARRGVASPEGSDDGFVPGEWDEIRDAYMDGLLSDAEYDELRESAEAPEMNVGRDRRAAEHRASQK